MKFRLFTLLLLAALAVSLVSGCAAPPVILETQPAAEAATQPAAALTLVPAAEETPAVTEAPASETTALISKEAAIAIALADAGFTEEQVTRLRAEYDRDNRAPEYDVEFQQGGYEYEYEIHAETGVILSKDKDWDD